MTLIQSVSDHAVEVENRIGKCHMKIAVMQPYFLPYIGYFQLFKAADEFVVYDNIEYTKKGWINRNQFLLNGKVQLFSIPLEKSSDYLNIQEKNISESFGKERKKILAQIESGYRKAPEYSKVYPLLERIFMYEERNLFLFNLNSIKEVLEYLQISIPIKISSEINVDHSLKGAEKVKSIVLASGSDFYINPIGGQCLYEVSDFESSGITLKFHNYKPLPYTQQGTTEFVSHMSIIDVLMNNSLEQVLLHLNSFELL